MRPTATRGIAPRSTAGAPSRSSVPSSTALRTTSGSSSLPPVVSRRETEKGREIRREMDELADDYFGAPTAQPASASAAAVRQATVSTAESVLAKAVGVAGAIPRGLRSGPANPSGQLLDASDRNLLCMDMLADRIVVGSADHGLKVYNAANGRELRSLYTKKFGHSEWVTSCAFLNDGRVVSGGMDSKLCLWHESAPRCDDLLGHTGSVSQVAVNHNHVAISSSYDRTLRVWDCAGRRGGGTCLATLAAHGNPVTMFSWYGGTLLSGDRKGQVVLWDLHASTALAKLSTAGGQIGSLGFMLDDENDLAMAGDQAGCLTAWDFRRVGTTPVFQAKMHQGVLSGIKSTTSGTVNMIVTVGADKRMLCLDPRNMSAPVLTFEDHRDFIYSLETYGDLVLSGAGNGWLLVHDLSAGKCQYALGANAAAVRCISVNEKYLVAAGDDGKAIIYSL